MINFAITFGRESAIGRNLEQSVSGVALFANIQVSRVVRSAMFYLALFHLYNVKVRKYIDGIKSVIDG